MKQAFIIDGVRTAVGSFGGSLAHTRADDMAAHVIRELVKKLPGIDPGEISDVIMGCANQAGEDNRNVARMALLLAGIPYTVPGETVNRLCASGMSAVIHACRAIRSDEGEAFIAGGVENMTRGPWVISKASTPFGRDAEMHDTSFGWRFINKEMQRMYGTDSMGNTAENLAQKFGISRDDQDAFALWSQEKAAAARHSGRLGIEIVPIEVKKAKETILFDADEFIKPSTTAEILSRLNPAFRKAEAGGSVTAGNSSGLNDGAAALLTASEDFIKKNNLKPLSR
ncbi:MAG TPA: acetyl-CoA C-acyltransferase, partial [Saprospiraceae bacterium]|nr:acetyl-CoA C-acyltransferase [Saprospiraceae bacterium]